MSTSDGRTYGEDHFIGLVVRTTLEDELWACVRAEFGGIDGSRSLCMAINDYIDVPFGLDNVLCEDLFVQIQDGLRGDLLK